ncbi:uncharacterized protein LOC132202305 [Neocloeon triangulifer]|uniref:uncharacterized protein LOC132202305 n=1 Tax=Neocloeon triangulifer TaxID=2078957 RepID=UPI00286F6450|nr:uncharacterized protein LOC132202305 [Neocloeon triangulifer]XP_059485127.1 uncharacterized protein LOC132202305 [Neocloeon triangulifer]
MKENEEEYDDLTLEDWKVSVSLQMNQKRWKAVKEGKMTDVTFSVGPDGDEENAQPVFANKFDLMVASEYFATLILSVSSAPQVIKINNVEPHIFQMLIEFIHKFSLDRDIESLDDAVKLTRAAFEYKVEELVIFTTKMIATKFLRPDTIWLVLDSLSDVPIVALECRKILAALTEDCLHDPSFLNITAKSLEIFLKIRVVNVSSEIELVWACIRLIEARDQDRALIQVALQNLRLSTVEEQEELSVLLQYLTDEEKIAISLRMHSNDTELPTTSQRAFLAPSDINGKLIVMPDNYEEQSVVFAVAGAKFRLKFTPKRRIKVGKIFLGDFWPEAEGPMSNNFNYIDFIATVAHRSNGNGQRFQGKVTRQYLDNDDEPRLVCNFESPVFVPTNAVCCLQVHFKTRVCCQALDAITFLGQDMVFDLNSKKASEIFENVFVVNPINYAALFNAGDEEFGNENNNYCLVKSFNYSVIM